MDGKLFLLFPSVRCDVFIITPTPTNEDFHQDFLPLIAAQWNGNPDSMLVEIICQQPPILSERQPLVGPTNSQHLYFVSVSRLQGGRTHQDVLFAVHSTT